VSEFDLFVPLYYNDGSPIESRKFQKLQKRLLGEFDGLTYFPQPNTGFWKMGEILFQDEIVIYRVVTESLGRARRFFARLKKDLKKELKQEEILIIERKVRTL